ncbi:MAG TPA: protein-L-isoaspartate(D-aspartate) O-methyltransferase [Pyrinomonadaceae bacterium]|nr:protein-L-isoaspartate(D-aspartate) O-methyltransferase [Pyrinomonadaceae bacterium]
MSAGLKRQCISIRLALLFTILFFISCSPMSFTEGTSVRDAPPQGFTQQRQALIDQLKSEGITNAEVLNAMLKVPRHEFVPTSHRHYSYQNRPLPIGHNQTISQPFIVGYMTQAASIAPGEKVLEIGTGSGYQAAVLAEVAGQVYTIEIIPELAEGAKSVLGKLGYKNVHVKTGNGYEGWPEHAPFDAIVVTAAPDEVPQKLVDQLALRGKMVIPVGSTFQEMVIITRDESGVVERRTIPVQFVPMTGKPKQ